LKTETILSAADLSLVGGGVSARILERLVRIHARDRRGYVRLAIILAAATWVPLALLSALNGAAVPGAVLEPFSHDLTPHVRFLFALPLLIIADLVVGPQLVRVARQFVASGLVPKSALPDFETIAKAAIRLGDSNVWRPSY
jgi:hypothetical protein